MDKLYEQTMLFDFYGELLTEHQRRVYADAVYNDMSLGEIAEEQGISRQGVHDLLRRCDKILQDYESRLHLVERFARAKKTVKEIQELSTEMAKEFREASAATAQESREASAGVAQEFREASAGAAQELREAPAKVHEVSAPVGLSDFMSRLEKIGELSRKLIQEL